MSRDDISVLITTYNQEAFVDKAIQSVLEQIRKPKEIIIVDDGSTDETPAIIEQFANQHPELIETHLLEEERGIPQTRNYALEQANGELVTYLDGDDVFRPSKLAKEYETFVDNPDATVVFSNFEYIDVNGNTIETWDVDEDVPVGNVFKECLTRSFPDGSLFRDELVPAEILRKIGGYDEQLSILEDWDLRIRLAQTERAAYVPQPLTAYRRYGAGISDRKALKESEQIYEYIIEKHGAAVDERFENWENIAIKLKQKKLLAEKRMYTAANQGALLQTMKNYLVVIALDPSELFAIRKHLRGGVERFLL
jgi:glycosyltransferase involved in cell wall biosynthesis